MNPKPNNMDLALFIRDRHQKGKLKLALGVLGHVTIEEVLITLFRYMPKHHQLAVSERDCQNIFFIDKSTIGYIKGYACSSVLTVDPIITKSEYAEDNAKFDSAIIEQDDYIWEGIKIGSKTVPVLDHNFLLSKSTKLIEPEEVIHHLNVNCSFEP